MPFRAKDLLKGLAQGTCLDVAGFWKLLQIYIFNSGPDPPNPQIGREKAAPDPPDIVGQPKEIVDFRSRGGGPVGHP